ncbi:MAG: sugar ABC transporter permease [Phycisphaeraceae bacterium]|nr:sugar ABC transporter permease [Phycisphaeraceae bacterium]
MSASVAAIPAGAPSGVGNLSGGVRSRARAGSGGRLAPWLFLSPFLACFALFTLYPLVQSVVLSMQTTFGPGATKFVGLSNFRGLMHDPLFWIALKNTAVYTLGSLLIQLPIALGLALVLETPGLRGRGWIRLLLFSPSMVGVVFAAMMFALIFEKQTGLANQGLHSLLSPLGIDWSLDFGWLQQHVMSALILASLWMYVGFNMTFFSAALQNVRKDLIEAAVVDGAGPLRRFWTVTIPAIRPVAGFVVLMSVIGSFQLFELPFIMFNNTGGPDNRALTIVLYLFQNGFETGDLGYASAIGWALAVILVVCAAFQRLTARGEEAAA